MKLNLDNHQWIVIDNDNHKFRTHFLLINTHSDLNLIFMIN